MKAVTAEMMQRLDRRAIEECGIPGMVLMENAGRGTVAVIERHYPRLDKKKVAIFAGKGNNGGDGFVIARYLFNMGAQVKVYLLTTGDNLRGDARSNFNIIRHMGIDILELREEDSLDIIRDDLRKYDLIIDAIFGTGISSEVRGIFRQIIEIVNNTDVPKVSVDIPSGLNADTGKVLGISVTADLTVTFAHPKLGLLIYPGSAYVGKLETVDISIPKYLIEEEDIQDHLIDEDELRALFQWRDTHSHKGDFGHLLVLAGSTGKTGAASLTCQGAMRVGVGLVTLAVAESLNPIMESKLTEVMTESVLESKPGFFSIEAFEQIIQIAEKKNAFAIGPGISTERQTVELVYKIIKEVDIPLIIDADGLNALSTDINILRKAKAQVILTPHPGEMSRLTHMSIAEVQNDRIGVSRRFAQEWNVYLVLKGHKTIIADPQGNIYINPTGNPGMATAGMGDALTGMLSGFVAQGYDMVNAARLAVFSHGLAGDCIASERGEIGLLATDIIERIPWVLNQLKINYGNIDYRNLETGKTSLTTLFHN
ncbi:MAG: NAD(P)H-hydrate dehydratase [Thermodesulfobacteriota bacterium]|nr:NAD(P)H-hydrate dehydratase [Thermodesulfobacteriota bacterium]